MANTNKAGLLELESDEALVTGSMLLGEDDLTEGEGEGGVNLEQGDADQTGAGGYDAHADGDMGAASGGDRDMDEDQADGGDHVWTSIARGDDAAIFAFCAAEGISERGAKNIKGVLDAESIKSSEIELLNLRDYLEDEDALDILKGSVTVSTSDGSSPTGDAAARRAGASGSRRITRGFAFDENADQTVVLARYRKRTRLEAPDEETGRSVGVNTVIQAMFPETTGDPKDANGRPIMVGNQPASYRPGFRLMSEWRTDYKQHSDIKNQPLNCWFNQSPRGAASDFSLQLPELLILAAQEAGATRAELCVRDIVYAERLLNRLGNESAYVNAGEAPAPAASYSRASGGSRLRGDFTD